MGSREAAPQASDRLRRMLNLVFALSQTLAPFLSGATGLGEDIATRANAVSTPVTPAPYAFAIWPLIYAACIAYAIHQALPAQRTDPLLRRIGFLTAAAFLANTLWAVVAQLQGVTWPTAFIIAAALAATLAAMLRALPHPLTPARRWLVLFPVSLLAGWLSVAAPANVASALQAASFGAFGLPEPVFAGILVGLAGILGAAFVLASRGNPFYTLGVVWGLAGVVVADLDQAPGVAAVAGGMALLAIVAAGARRIA